MRLVRLLEAHGRDAVAVCRNAQVSIDEVTCPSARVPYRVADALVDACVAELGAHGFAIKVASIFDEHTYDAAALVLMSSATFGEGLERALAYQRLWGDGERFSLRRDADGGVVRFRHPGPSATARSVLSELALIETMNAARSLVAPHAKARAVRFAHPRIGSDDSKLAGIFGVAPTYGARECELVLGEDILGATIRMPTEALIRMHDHLAARALAALPTSASLAARLRALCQVDPSSLSVELDTVAQRLRLPARTLQRRLAAEGTSWSDLLDELRRAQVRRLELRGAAEKEIAFFVGFSDPSALARARRRWRAQK